MTIQIRNIQTAANGGSPRTVNKPTGTVAGDTLVLHVGPTSATAPTPPTGFTLITGASIGGTDGIYIYSKVAGASEPADYTVTFGAGNALVALMGLYSDTAAELVVDVVGSQDNGSGNRIWPSVITTIANTLLACFATLDVNVASTPPGGSTEQYDLTGTNRIYLMTETVAATGATGTRTATGSASANRCVVIAFAEGTPAIISQSLDRMRLYLLQPAVVFKARVNAPATTYPIISIPYDGVTVGAFGDIEFGMTIAVGSTDGDDDLGRQRIRDGSTSSSLKVPRSSQGRHDGEFDIVDNAYITVYDDYRVWARPPHIDVTDIDAPVQYKDGDIPVGTFTTTPVPVANCGPGTAATIVPGSGAVTVTFDGSDSFATADGATITTYLWDVADGTITVGTSASDAITATFPAGFRWVKLTVTDSNGKTHFARCPVFARDPAADLCVSAWQMESHQIAHQGQRISARILSDIPRSAYPDGTLALIWQGEPASASDRSHMLFIGWHDENADAMAAQRTATLRDTVLSLYDVAGRLDTIYGSPQTILAKTTPATWSEMVNPTWNKWLHYLLQWHSTALQLADYFPSLLGDDIPFTTQESEAVSILRQLNDETKSMTPDHYFTCDRLGRLYVVPDPILQATGSRTGTVQMPLTDADWSDIRYEYRPDPRVHWLRSNAVKAELILFETEEELLRKIGTFFCVAPGTAPGQGESEQVSGGKIALSQTALNVCEGNRYARLNAKYGRLRIQLAYGDDMGIEPAYLEWITLTVSAANRAQRNLPFDVARLLPWEVNIRYDHARTGLVKTVEIVAELETSGPSAVTEIHPQLADPPTTGLPPDYFDDNPGEIAPPPGPPDDGLIGGQENVVVIDAQGTSNFIFRTFDFQTPSGSGGPTWEEVALTTGETNHFSWVVDPFSPGYLGTGQSIDGWVAGNDGIWRLTNLFGVTTAVEARTFDETASGASFHWRTIGASFGAYFSSGNPWLLCISYYGSTAAHTGVWATYSLDAGATWSDEVQVSAFYDNGSPGEFAPIALWMSPRTPGFALCCAHLTTASPPTAAAYATYDWGATWSLYASDEPPMDPDEPVPYWAFLNQGESVPAPFITWGAVASAEVTADADPGPDSATPGTWQLLLVAPPNTKKVTLSGHWETEQFAYGLATLNDTDVELIQGVTGITQTTDFDDSAEDSTAEQDFALVWQDTAGFDASITDIQEVIDNHPTTNPYPQGQVTAGSSAGFAESGASSRARMDLEILSIELMNGHIYTPPTQNLGVIDPVNRLAGSIHIPWPDNLDETVLYHGKATIGATRQFRLIRVDGDTTTDVSPLNAGIRYGVNRNGFAVRTHDSNRQYVVAGVVGNDASAVIGDDVHRVYISSDYGDTWTLVVGPITNANAPRGISAAFGGDSEQVLYLWGPTGYIRYSSNFGAAVDDRSGDIDASVKAIGIAGGPS